MNSASNAPARRQRQTRATFLFLIVVTLLAMAASRAGIDDVSDGRQNTLLVTVEYPGGDQTEIEASVTIPLEDQIALADGVQEIRSITYHGRTVLQVQFHDRVSRDSLYLEARERIDRAAMHFPPAAGRPILNRGHLNSRPVFIAALPLELWTEKRIQRLFDGIDGVGRVEVGGFVLSEIRLEVEPVRLPPGFADAAEVARVIQNTHTILSSRRTGLPPLVIDSRRRSIEQLAATPASIGTRMDDLVRVSESVAPMRATGSVDGKPFAVVLVHKAGDTTIVEVGRRLRETMEGVDSAIVLLDRGGRIEASVREVGLSVLIGCAGIFVLVLLCERSAMRGAIAGVTVLFSALAGVAALGALNLPLTVTTLAAVAVSAGLSVDTALFFLDAVRVHNGSWSLARSRSTGSIVFSCLTTTIVFIPILFSSPSVVAHLGGVAVVITCSLAAAGIFVLGFVPCLKEDEHRIQKPPAISRRRKMNAYRQSLRVSGWAARRYKLVAGLAGLLVLPAAWSVCSLLANRVRPWDGDSLPFLIEFPAGTTVEAVRELSRQVEQALDSVTGIGTVIASYEGERAKFELHLDRNADRPTVRKRLERSISTSGTLIFPDDLSTDAGGTIPVVVRGPELAGAQRIAIDLAGRIRTGADVSQVLYQFKPGVPVCTVEIHTGAAARAGSDPASLYSRLRWVTGREVIAKWQQDGAELDVVMTGFDPAQSTCAQLAAQTIVIANRPVPLSQLATVSSGPGATAIERQDRARSAGLLVSTTNRQKTTRRIAEDLERMSIPFPYVVHVDPGRQQRTNERNTAFIAATLAAFLLCAVLVVQFENLRLPLLVLAQMPVTLSVPLLALAWFGIGPDLAVLSGLFLCCGSSANNSILVFNEYQRGHGRQPDRVMEGAARPGLEQKLLHRAIAGSARPITLAAVTTVIGVLPLVVQARSGGVSMLGTLSITITLGVITSLASTFVLLPALACLFQEQPRAAAPRYRPVLVRHREGRPKLSPRPSPPEER